MRDNWTGVLHSCLENQAYPTVLFYEKLVSFEEDAQYEPRRGFTLVGIELGELQREAYLNSSEDEGSANERLIAQ